MAGKAKDETEAEITRAIRQCLNGLGCWHWKHWSGPMTHPKGISDIIGIWETRFLAIEIKTKKGRVSEHQEKFLEHVRRNGGIAFVARSIDDVIKGLGVEDRFLLGQ